MTNFILQIAGKRKGAHETHWNNISPEEVANVLANLCGTEADNLQAKSRKTQYGEQQLKSYLS